MKLFSDDDEGLSLLKVHEWLAIAIIIGVVGGLACLTSFYGRGGPSHMASEAIVKSGFDVFIKGAVANPGVYHIQTEMKMKDVLALARVNPEADLRRISLDAIVKKGRVINVPVRAMMTVYLKGAVKAEQILTVPKGSKVEDLLQLVEFSEGANLNALKKKRRLKPDEVVVIPFLEG